MKRLRNFGQTVLDFVYPEHARCMGCGDLAGTEEGWLCEQCMKKLQRLSMEGRRICPRCGVALVESGNRCRACRDWPQDGARFVRFAYGYAYPIDHAIQNMKYVGVYRMTRWMGESVAQLIGRYGYGRIDALVPVAMHPARQRERGQNHALCLAEAVSELTGIPVWDILQRTRNAPQQARLAGIERRESLKGAYKVKENTGPLDGKRLVLIDDVVTTGTTVNECAKVLYANGAECVSVAAFSGHLSRA